MFKVAETINTFHQEFHGERLFTDYKEQLNFTTKIYRPRGLHLDDRHLQTSDGESFSAAIADVTLYVTNNYKQLLAEGSPIVLYLPKIQTAEEAAMWNRMLGTLEEHLNLKRGTIKTYVLVEQVELTFQLMETRAVLAERFVGFNTGRWDYINDMVKKKSWDPNFIHPNIEEVNLLYPYMAEYEDRVRKACNTPDRNGKTAFWQDGMESSVPVGSKEGVKNALERVKAGAQREQKAGASGKWSSHWKMVKVIREIWKNIGKNNQLDKRYDQALTYTQADKEALYSVKNAPRTMKGVRNLISVALQYGNACLQGHQAAALKAADSFGDDSVMYAHLDITDSYTVVDIEAQENYAGGIIGRAVEDAHAPRGNITLKNVYAAGKISTAGHNGGRGIVGNKDQVSPRVKSIGSFFNKNTTKKDYSGDRYTDQDTGAVYESIAVTTFAMTSRQTFIAAGWSTDIWDLDLDGNYPTLK